MALFVSKTLAELDTPVDPSGRETFEKRLLSNLSLQKSKSEEFVVQKKNPGTIGEDRPSKTKSLSPKSWQSSLKNFSLSKPMRSSSIPPLGLNGRGSFESSVWSSSESSSLITSESRRSSLSGSTERGSYELTRQRGSYELTRERGLSESSGRSLFDLSRRSSFDFNRRSSLESSGRSSSESRGSGSSESRVNSLSESRGSSSSESRESSSSELKKSGDVRPRKIKSFDDFDLNLKCDKSFISQQVSEFFYSFFDHKVEEKPKENDIKIMYGSRDILDFQSNTQSRLMINYPASYTAGDNFSYFKNNDPIKEERCKCCNMPLNPPIDYAAIVTLN